MQVIGESSYSYYTYGRWYDQEKGDLWINGNKDNRTKTAEHAQAMAKQHTEYYQPDTPYFAVKVTKTTTIEEV